MTNSNFKLCDEHKLIQNVDKTIYHWVFHYNYFTGEWNAIPRDEIPQYFNGNSKYSVSDADISNCIKKAVDQEILRRKNV